MITDEIEQLRKERDDMAAHSERLATALQHVLDESIDDYYKTHDCDGVIADAKSALEAKPFDSLAHVRADAVEEAAKACMPGPCSPPDDPPQGYQEYCEGIASVKEYADHIRNSATQEGG